MDKRSKIGLTGIGLVAGAALLATLVGSVSQEPAKPKLEGARVQLASISTGARQNIDYAALDRRLKLLMEEPAMVGLAVGLVENGRITFLSGYGETLAGSGEKVTPETVFRWASVSKGVAGTMVGKLAEQGKLSFHTPVAQLSPSLKLPAGAENRATVGDVLSHRLGLYRNAYDNKLEEGQGSALLRSSLAQLNLICQPGTCWSYQNIAFDASSEIVERITGQPYGQALQEHLFLPIGMTSASVTREGLVNSPSWARPHSAGKKELEVLEPYYRVPAAGGVNSNIKDLSLWMIAQMGLMPDAVSPKVLETVHAPVVDTPVQRRRLRKFLERVGDVSYGYGWRNYEYAGHRLVGHRGGVAGYRSLILFDPKLKSGVVALWNSNTTQPAALEFEVMDMVYRLSFRDWLELGSRGAGAADGEEADGGPVEASAETVAQAGGSTRAS